MASLRADLPYPEALGVEPHPADGRHRLLLRQVKDRGEAAIVHDPARGFIGEFYWLSRGDLVLNPLDVTENRKHGNPVVLGFQGRSQLEKRYGQDAEAMLSQPATKVFFKTSEPRAAQWVSDAIGKIEVEHLKESRTPRLLTDEDRILKRHAYELQSTEEQSLWPLTHWCKHGSIR